MNFSRRSGITLTAMVCLGLFSVLAWNLFHRFNTQNQRIPAAASQVAAQSQQATIRKQVSSLNYSLGLFKVLKELEKERPDFQGRIALGSWLIRNGSFLAIPSDWLKLLEQNLVYVTYFPGQQILRVTFDPRFQPQKLKAVFCHQKAPVFQVTADVKSASASLEIPLKMIPIANHGSLQLRSPGFMTTEKIDLKIRGANAIQLQNQLKAQLLSFYFKASRRDALVNLAWVRNEFSALGSLLARTGVRIEKLEPEWILDPLGVWLRIPASQSTYQYIDFLQEKLPTPGGGASCTE